MAVHSESRELLQQRTASGRVFIFGAGASVYSGFPLGRDLWAFLVDHCGIDDCSAMEWIDAHLSSLPERERTDTVSDLELLLTTYVEDKLPSIGCIRKGDQPRPRSNSKDRTAFLDAHRHQVANKVTYDFEAFYKARLARRASTNLFWNMDSMKSFVGTLARAFLHHHACIRFGGRHHAASTDPDPCPTGYFRSRCPCFRKYSENKLAKLTGLIARTFIPGDTIITFNWDALLESILCRAGKWNPFGGYGIQVTLHPMQLRRLKEKSRRTRQPSPIKILKAHGSINWVINHEDGSFGINYLGLLFGLPIYSTYLPDREKYRYNEFNADEPFWDDPDWPHTNRVLLSPTYKKNYDHGIYRMVWDQAVAALERASQITVVGYSLPLGDAAARSRLADALRRNRSCTAIEIVTGDIHKSHWPAFLGTVGKTCVWNQKRSTFQSWIEGVSAR